MKVLGLAFCLAVPFCLFSCGLSGCEGKVDPDARVVVEGRIMVGTDSPYSNDYVFLHRSKTFIEEVYGALYFPWYWLDCILSEMEHGGSCGAWRTATSDGDGRYRFTFTGADTTNEIGQLLEFQVSAVRGTGRGSEIALLTFKVEQETLSFPDLHFWNDPPAAACDSSHVVLDWTGARVFGSQPAQLTDFVFVQGEWNVFSEFKDGPSMWEENGVEGQSLELDVRIFQDAVVSYRASDYIMQHAFSTVVEVQRTSPAGLLDQEPHLPASRGAGCTYATSLSSRTVQPCALTDGDFSTFFAGDDTICDEIPDATPYARCADEAFEEVIVELDDVVVDPTIFLHLFGAGVTSGLVLSVSQDGSQYSEVSSDLDSFTTHTPSGNVKYVRFRKDVEAQGPATGGMRYFLSELGVF